ncbi:hypothetical protein [Flavobacterium sp. KMS]|uniref:hypothetical protein n=1 Tax=unclassified Flavobacterium TaxID=196869 RepID=UPI00057D137D|nr:hypothetical protein [Flavobacterium sp. KMS]KIA97812.1 hypothetical protein OA93_12610 [Flavobacterium sp. KMS]
MKKLILNSFCFAAIGVLTLSTLSCKDSNKASGSEQSNPFAGTWVAKDFIDNIIEDNGIETVDNGVTEIIIPETLKDSITFLNEDLERGKYTATIKNDTLVNHLYETKTQKAVLQNGNLVLLPLDERYEAQEYVKADSTLVKKAKEANVSVVRILINKLLSGNTYSNKSSTTEIKFTEDGKVSGLANFKNYYISINGDDANTQGITSINFTTTDGTYKKMGIEFLKNKIELYDVVLLTKPDEKPSFKKGKLLFSLKVTKSK